MFFITVSNGLLKGHRQRMGAAVWEFMWCLDKITKIDAKGIGYVLGGKPIKLQEIADDLESAESTISENLTKLEKENYIFKINAPYGIIIKVNKAKKRFRKTLNPPQKEDSENTKPHSENTKPNKTVTDDSSIIINNNTTSNSNASVAEKDINSKIELFKPLNPLTYKKWYSNTIQRAAVSRLIEVLGDKLELVINTAIQANTKKYAPTITTPLQLEEKLSALRAWAIKEKSNLPTIAKIR